MAEPPQTPVAHAHPVAEAYRTYADLLFAIGVRTCRVPSDDVQPLVNDVFVSFMRHHAMVRNARAWLLGAMKNACAEYWRRKGDFAAAEELSSDYVDPKTAAESLELEIDLRRAIAQLSDRCRRVLLLRFYRGLSTLELADALAVTPNNAKQLVHRCTAAVRRLFLERRRA